MVGVDLVVLVATSLTFETSGFFIVSVNPMIALSPLMEEPDISLELDFEARVPDGGFKSVTGLAAFGAVLARDAAGIVPAARFTALCLAAVFAVVFAAEFTLLFAAVLAGFAIALVVPADVLRAGWAGCLAAFDSGLAAVFWGAFRAVVPTFLLFDGAAGFTAVLAPLRGGDLVTVAFMVCLHY